MGCFSSKITTRSRSLREEMSLSLNRRTNGFPAIEGLINKPKNGEEQILALLPSGNSSLKKLQPKGDEKASNPPNQPANPETLDVWELMRGQEDGVKEQEEEPKVPIIDRKFHTLEEYDALVAARQRHQNPLVTVSTAEQGTGNSTYHGAQSARSSVSTDDAPAGDPPIEIGCRRRSMANKLKRLKVQSFEFSGVGVLGEWIAAGGQVFSPGSYDTPKFGKSAGGGGKGGGHGRSDPRAGGGIAGPELPVEVEEATGDLTEEEERIIAEMLELLK